MKKGFTLVELMAVLIVLAVISMIALPAIMSSLEESRQKSYDSQVERIIVAAKKWAIDNNDLLPEEGTYKVSITTLISGQYIGNVENGKLKNPKSSGEFMDGCVNITYSEGYNQYIYNYQEEC